MIQFWQLSRADARRLNDFIARSERRWLAQLAHWVSGTGTPVQQFDFSVASLEPLWEWWVSFERDELEHVPPAMLPEFAVALRGTASDVEEDRVGVRRAWLRTALMHYIAATIRRYDPSAHWAVKLPGGVAEFGDMEPVFWALGRWDSLPLMPPPFSRMDAGVERPPALMNSVMTYWFEGGKLPALGEPPYSMLELSREPIPASEEIPLLEVTPEEERRRERRRRDVSFETVVVRSAVPDDSEDALAAGESIPAEPLLAMLAAIGATPEEGRLDSRTLLDDQQLAAYGGGMNIETVVMDGTVRAVLFDALSISPSQHRGFKKELRRFVTAVDVRLIDQEDR